MNAYIWVYVNIKMPQQNNNQNNTYKTEIQSLGEMLLLVNLAKWTQKVKQQFDEF